MASKLKRKSTAVAVKSVTVTPWKPVAPPERPKFGLEFKVTDHGPIKSVTTSADGSQHIEFHYPVK